MDIESIRQYCLQKLYVSEEFPFDETTLVFKVAGKMFACMPLEKPDMLVLDLMLTKQDGLSVLKAVGAMEKRPITLVTSAFVRSTFAFALSTPTFALSMAAFALFIDSCADRTFAYALSAFSVRITFTVRL